MDGMQSNADFNEDEAESFGSDQEEESLPGDIVGIVYGDIGTAELKCSVTAPLEKGEYVKIKHQTCGDVLGQIDKMERKTDLSLDRAIQMSEGEQMDIQEKVLAMINIIGYRDERGLLQAPKVPFKAGTPRTN